jgi:hypothetical protein
MKSAFIFVTTVIALVTGFWGYAFELAYFAYLKLNVHTIFGPVHFLYSGLSVIGPMFVILLVFALLMKFFSKDIAQDELKVVSERLSKSKFTEEIGMARVGFLLSLVFLLLVIFDIRPPSFGEGHATGLGSMFVLFTFFNIQLFFGSICLSPPHSRGAVVVAFVLAVAMCFAAGGIDTARISAQSDKALRDDWLVKVYKKGGELVAEPRAVSLPFPLLNKALQWLGTK